MRGTMSRDEANHHAVKECAAPDASEEAGTGTSSAFLHLHC